MMDPLSITASAVSLLGVCLKVSVELKKFRQGCAEARTTVTAMLSDVKSLRDILQSMEDTFEELDSQPSTGHIGTHWTNLSRSLQDGRGTLERLEALLKEVNKDVSFLDAPRRQIRVKGAAEQIANFRQQIQTYKDALQLSLQTIILYVPHTYSFSMASTALLNQYLIISFSWNQVSIQESTSKILPNLDAMHADIRRLATNLDIKLHGLQQMFVGNNQQNQIDGVKNLRDFVQSAATVLSSASTILSAADQGDVLSEDGDDFRSDFGDWFRTETNASTLDWIYSNTGDSVLFEISETRTIEAPLPSTSILSTENLQASTLALPPGIRLNDVVSSRKIEWSSPTEQAPQPSLSSSVAQSKSDDRLEGNASETDVSVANRALVPASPPLQQMPIHQRSTSLNMTLSPVAATSSPKAKRRSLASLFSRRSPATEKSTLEEAPVPRQKKSAIFQKSNGAEIRRKFVLVGDGACGKTCFLM